MIYIIIYIYNYIYMYVILSLYIDWPTGHYQKPCNAPGISLWDGFNFL